MPEKRYVAHHKQVDLLDASKLRDWMIEQLRAVDLWDEQARRVVRIPPPGGATFISMSTSWGVGTRRVYEILQQNETLVPVELVDRIFCRAGEPYLLNELYEQELDRLWPLNVGQGELDLWGDEARLDEQLTITA